MARTDAFASIPRPSTGAEQSTRSTLCNRTRTCCLALRDSSGLWSCVSKVKSRKGKDRKQVIATASALSTLNFRLSTFDCFLVFENLDSCSGLSQQACAGPRSGAPWGAILSPVEGAYSSAG
jgi:hypothetical protein